MAIKKTTKNDLIDGIFERTSNLERQDIIDVVDALFEEVKQSLISGATIELRGFGTFELCPKECLRLRDSPPDRSLSQPYKM